MTSDGKVIEDRNAAQRVASKFKRAAVTPHSQLFNTLWPGHNSFEIAEALGHRTTAAHVRMWRSGARPLPAWLRDLARLKMATIAEALELAPRGNGREAGWNNLGSYRASRHSKS